MAEAEVKEEEVHEHDSGEVCITEKILFHSSKLFGQFL